ncbi:porin family protein [Hymenobacter sp. H14-R3]|uniref:porin family protein n=1 Tax=Hymenobacter sp. H14-R3 TaxID=3046308 RepID=UPI0024BA5C54|nr:porin family protein [Hymenobacter sp. H14-R3]MDJ0365665.1 porin family protein [Hymenobacter sp. H14-R3]
MKNILCCLGLLAGLATPAAAQDRRAALPAPVARPAVWNAGSRPGSRADMPASPRPGWQPACPTYRTLDVASVALGVLQTVHMVRFLRAHPEVLTTYPAAPEPTCFGRRWAAAAVGRPAGSGALAARFGVKAGFNLAGITGSNDRGYKYRGGFSAGFMADVPFNELVSFHPELLYAQKGARYSGTDELSGIPVGIDGTLRLHYLDLPLLARLKTGGFFVEAGPQLGYLLGVREEATATIAGLGPFADSNTDLAGYRRLDVGYVLGVGYQLPQGLEASLRYNGGLSDLQNPSDDPKLRNSVFQLQVGYAFGK